MNGSKARKLRKENPKPNKVKVPTPPHERSYVTAPVQAPGGTMQAAYSKPRSEKSIKRFLERFTSAQVTPE